MYTPYSSVYFTRRARSHLAHLLQRLLAQLHLVHRHGVDRELHLRRGQRHRRHVQRQVLHDTWLRADAHQQVVQERGTGGIVRVDVVLLQVGVEQLPRVLVLRKDVRHVLQLGDHLTHQTLWVTPQTRTHATGAAIEGSVVEHHVQLRDLLLEVNARLAQISRQEAVLRYGVFRHDALLDGGDEIDGVGQQAQEHEDDHDTDRCGDTGKTR